jgi:Family of unknown function (DUF6188)
VTYKPESTYPADLLARGHETPEGWSLPLRGNVTSWIYVSLLDFAFEVWLGGDFDVTVRLERPFTYGPKQSPTLYDPRAGRKGNLAPLLDLDDLTVAEFLVKRVGELEIGFTDGSRLGAGPADDGEAWCLEWPIAGDVSVAARPGGGLLWPKAVRSTDPPTPDGPIDATAYREPMRRGGILDLPIAGPVAESTASSVSIELAVPISGSDRYDIHFGGALEIVDGAGELWRGRGDAEVRSSLGRVLDLVGNRVSDAHADKDERLHLAFADGAQLLAEAGRWEAHWPIAAGSLDEHWVPREGPSIP